VPFTFATILIHLYIKGVGCPRTPPSRQVQELSLTRKRPPLYNINHRSEESPTAARHGVVPDIQAAGSDWDIDVGSSVVTVLGTDQILQI
jgi:hypothetical protein